MDIVLFGYALPLQFQLFFNKINFFLHVACLQGVTKWVIPPCGKLLIVYQLHYINS